MQNLIHLFLKILKYIDYSVIPLFEFQNKDGYTHKNAT